MDKLNKIAMPDVKSGTPQEKMNAVKKALQSLEMLTEAYNQIVPVINAKIDWLSEAEQVAKDDAQDKKIDELIAVNKSLLGRIKSLESKPAPKPVELDDGKIVEEISKINGALSSLDRRVDYLKRTYSEKWQQAEFERTKFQQSISEQIKAIEAPQEIDLSDIERRIENLESLDCVEYDDSQIKQAINELKSKMPEPVDVAEINKSIEMVKKSIPSAYDDAEIKKAISEIKASIPSPYNDRAVKTSISELKKSIPEKYDDRAIKKSISDIKKAIPLPVNLGGIESRLKKLEEKPNYFYNDKPVLKEIDSIKKELSDVKKSFNEIFE